jgi:hypothetical protein
MNFTKLFLIVSTTAGIIFLLISAQLYYFNQSSSGFSMTRYGTSIGGSVTAISSFTMGVILIIYSIWSYRIYKRDKNKNDDVE